jgi:putative molybdopterin biosynthesis protein
MDSILSAVTWHEYWHGGHSLRLLVAAGVRVRHSTDFDRIEARRLSGARRARGKTDAMNDAPAGKPARGQALIEAVRRAARQEQFLAVVSAEDARARFAQHLDLSPLPAESVPLAAALARVLAHDVVAPVDAPPFDRSNVDGFALRAADTVGASDAAPRRLILNAEVIACGHAPAVEVAPGTATTIATGGVIPRGADAVVMIEQTELIDDATAPAIEVRRAVSPGQYVSYAGSDMARGETLLRKGTRIGSREIGMLAACGLASIEVVRRPKVAVLSTGDELVTPGAALKPAGVYDSNGAIVAAAVTEAGGEAIPFGAFPDDEATLARAVREALAASDMVVLSGGTSKGAGDLSHRVVSKLGLPGVLVHGVALKPGKPLCLAVIEGKPLAVLPGFPTSAIFTFHAFVAPVIRARAGLPAETARTVEAKVPVRIPSELGRQEFVLVALIDGEDGMVALPSAKGSGSVTSFSQSDGFLAIDALASALDAGSEAQVTLIGEAARAPDIVITGSHCIALDAVIGALAEEGFSARTIAVGSRGGVAAALRGECDLAPVHLVDPATGIYNRQLLAPGLSLVKGWQRMQGFVYRAGDRRFDGKSVDTALKAALADANALMVNRNAGSGTRVLIDQLLSGARPAGYANQPRSHNAVAAAVAQGRADWGIAIESVAKLYGLGFLPIAPEDYDFLLVEKRRARPAVQAFLRALRDPATRARIAALRMTPAQN